MRFAVRSLCLALLPLAAACNGDDGSSPTGPSNTPPAATRIINVSGNLAFGDVLVGGQRDLSYTITNSGNATLTVTGTTVTGGLDAHTIASWTNGQIAAGASQTVTVRFQPTATGSYSGTISVNGDQTSGSNTLAISGAAPAPAVAGTWSGQDPCGTLRRHGHCAGRLLQRSRRLSARDDPADSAQPHAERHVGVGHDGPGRESRATSTGP